MKKILVFGAGKSATSLIDYLCTVCEQYDWRLILCDANLALAQSKIAGCKNAEAISIDVPEAITRKSLIQEADLVISMLPPHLHFLVANDCLDFSKHLLTASYIDEKIKGLAKQIEQKGLLFLGEMGLDPGIDHMSAMKIINQIKNEGGKISSFKSHCGGLVSPGSDDNPWHYKITWNPANIVMAGSSGAIYRSNGSTVEIPYTKVFGDCNEVDIPGLFPLAWYPNRDSLSYIDTYGLHEIGTFIRTTLRYPSFCRGWNRIVNMGLTDLNDDAEIKGYKTYRDWYLQKNKAIDILFNSSAEEEEYSAQINYLGLQSDVPVDTQIKSSALLLQKILEKKLAMLPHDKDMIVMLHEIGYEINGQSKEVKSSLVVMGEDQRKTAMAKTVGLPLGIAAKLILQNKIKVTGLHIPVLPEIYNPVLNELEALGIKFHEEIISLG
ncbi:MAG: saccharopine dehydrogenase C-terminal domain-containing protein [Ginsengibacter sp.]